MARDITKGKPEAPQERAADASPVTLVLLADVPEGKSGKIARNVPAARAAELMAASIARVASATDLDFAG